MILWDPITWLGFTGPELTAIRAAFIALFVAACTLATAWCYRKVRQLAKWDAGTPGSRKENTE